MAAPQDTVTAASSGDPFKPLTACLLGATGSGKSSTGNSLFGCRGEDEAFPVSDSSSSATTLPSIRTMPWRGGQQHVCCVDVPGLGDSRGAEVDMEHLANMAEVLKDKVRQVHVFLLVINSADARFSGPLKTMLRKFRDVFGIDFLRNAMIVFTHWHFDELSLKKMTLRMKKQSSQPAQSLGATTSFSLQEAKSTMFNQDLRQELGHDFDLICAFVDNDLNAFEKEDLEDMYGDELEKMLHQFEHELEKVCKFMLTSVPFQCVGIEALHAEREATAKRFLEVERLISGPEQEKNVLKRQLIQEKSVFKEGWLKYKLSLSKLNAVPSKRVYGVLRRQQLMFFNSPSEVDSGKCSPDSVELLHCFCGAAENRPWRLDGWSHSFTIYRPAREDLDQDAQQWTLRVEEESECQKWVLLVQEATRISESWSKIRQFHRNLHAAETIQEYEKSMDCLKNETMVIPVEWVLQQKQDGQEGIARVPTLQQAAKDLKRDNITVDGRLLPQPLKEELAAEVALRVLSIMRDRKDSGSIQTKAEAEEKLEEKALVLSRDVVLSCSRTLGDGDSLDAVRMLFHNLNLVEVIVDAAEVKPVSVRVLHPQGAEQSLCEDFKARAESGLPQFQGDVGAEALNTEKVRGMDMESVQDLRVQAIGHDSWIPDWHSLLCMRCGVQFRPWLRRHHCRKCGNLVCRNCSRQSVSLENRVLEGGGSRFTLVDSSQKGRVCFLCYQRAVIEDLDARKRRSSYASSCSDGFGSWTTEQGEAREFQIVIDMRQGGKLGLEIARVPSGTLLIEAVKEGLAKTASARNATHLEPGQHIVEVNGVKGVADRLLDEIKKNKVLEITIRRQEERPIVSGESGEGLQEGTSPHSFSSNASEPRSGLLEAAKPEPPEDDDSEWPVVSVEMGSRHKVCNGETLDLLFVLDCTWVRQVRWNGIDDTGRVIINVSRPAVV